MAIILFLLLNILVYGTSAVSIMLELKQNVLRFGYGVNFRYEGMLAHSFDRFYVVTRIEIPKVLDLNLTLFQFDYNYSHVGHMEKDTKFKIPSTIKDMFKVYCRNIIPYMYLYKHQVEYYEKTIYKILEKDIGMILPKFGNTDNTVQSKCPKRQIISALISGFCYVGQYEGKTFKISLSIFSCQYSCLGVFYCIYRVYCNTQLLVFRFSFLHIT